MFSHTYYQPQQEIFEEITATEFEIINPNFKTCTTPLEEIVYTDRGIQIYLDDQYNVRHKITFTGGCVKILITSVDCANYYYTPDTFCRILQIKNSKLIEELKKKSVDDPLKKALGTAKHYILPLQDNLIEVVSWGISIEKV